MPSEAARVLTEIVRNNACARSCKLGLRKDVFLVSAEIFSITIYNRVSRVLRYQCNIFIDVRNDVP